MTTEAEKPDTAVPSAPMAPSSDASTANAAAAAPAAASAADAKPVAPAPPAGRGAKPKKKPSSGPGGMPNRRMIDAVPMLKENFGNAPRLDDIDAEIAGELEAALGQINQNDMIAGNTSREDRKDAAATGEQAGRKKGKILAIHGP